MYQMDDALAKYYPMTFSDLPKNFQNFILTMMRNRLDFFVEVSQTHNMSLTDVYQIVYEKYHKFPYFLNNAEVLLAFP